MTTSPAPDPAIAQAIACLEDRLKETRSSADPAAIVALLEEIFDENLIDIHASGWIYTRAQSIEFEKNLALRGKRDVKVLRASSAEHRMQILSESTVAVTALHETYYEVPNPQALAMAAGTFTLSPEAAGQVFAPPFGPGEDYAPNPYRTRITHVWVKKDDLWKLSLSQATRVGKRLRIGFS